MKTQKLTHHCHPANLHKTSFPADQDKNFGKNLKVYPDKKEIAQSDSQIELVQKAIEAGRKAGYNTDERLACYVAGYLSKYFTNN